MKNVKKNQHFLKRSFADVVKEKFDREDITEGRLILVHNSRFGSSYSHLTTDSYRYNQKPSDTSFDQIW